MEIGVICLSIGFLGLLGFLGFYISDTRNYIGEIHKQLVSMPADLQKLHTRLTSENDAKTHQLIQESFRDFLKHIEKLERMTLPKPVTEKDVKSVLSRIGTIADESLEIENEIEKTPDKGVQLPNDEWTGFINGDTKVAFEDEEIPTIVEDTPVVVK
jgi:hypothetical protein